MKYNPSTGRPSIHQFISFGLRYCENKNIGQLSTLLIFWQTNTVMLTWLSVQKALHFFSFCQIDRGHSVLVHHLSICSGLHESPHQLGRPVLRRVVKRRLSKFVDHLDDPSFGIQTAVLRKSLLYYFYCQFSSRWGSTFSHEDQLNGPTYPNFGIDSSRLYGLVNGRSVDFILLMIHTFAFRQNVLCALHVLLLDGHVHGALLVPSGGELQIV